MKRGLSLVIVFLFLFFVPAEVLATDLNQRQNELNQVGDSIEDAKDELNRVNREQSSINAQLDSIDRELSQKENELKQTEAQLAKTQRELDNTRSELQEVEENLIKTQEELEEAKEELDIAIEEAEKQEVLMADRIRSMYMNSTASYLELLLESKSINDFLDRVVMIGQLIAFDQEVLTSMEEYRDQVEIKKSALEEKEQIIKEYKDEVEAKKVELERKEQSIIATRAAIDAQKKEIELKRQEREVALEALDGEKAKIQRELDELEQLSKKLESTIQKLIREQEEKRRQEEERRRQEEERQRQEQQSNPQEEQQEQQQSNSRGDTSSGAMIWPVPGYRYVSSGYGNRTHPITGRNSFHTGIDIAGAGINGKPAVAVADGVVILAQYYGGYGNTVIIDHGGGITTLYAHGSSIPVSVGQTVSRGQTVLLIGSTGNSTGPHLHFEVRINGRHTNPRSYVG